MHPQKWRGSEVARYIKWSPPHFTNFTLTLCHFPYSFRHDFGALR